MHNTKLKQRLFSCLTIVILLYCSALQAEYLDRIVAVVEDDVILDSELKEETAAIAAKLKAGNMMIPPDFILRKQVLERIIIDKLQRQLAARSGIKISEEALNAAVADIARQNGMDVPQFREQLRQQGMEYQKFVDSVRNEIIINQLRSREIGGRIRVTDREVEHYLETHGDPGIEKIQYHLGHILIAIPEGASATSIQKASKKAQRVVRELREGKDFKETAISVSDGAQALQGGDLGWRYIGQVPTIFVDIVKNMQEGQISDPIRSPSGFHVIKILDMKGAAGKHVVTQTKVRHILIKTNELIDDAEAKKRLLRLRERIAAGESFEVLARPIPMTRARH